MTDIALTLRVDRPIKTLRGARSHFVSLDLACTRAAFALSVAFTFAVVFGVVR